MEFFSVFFNEVVESLTRGLEEDLSCENLIFEINGSRYAYRISLEEASCIYIWIITINYYNRPIVKLYFR